MEDTSSSMASPPVDVKALSKRALSRFFRFLRLVATSALAEARCAWRLTPEIENFVFAAEGATFDAGVIVHGTTDAIWSSDPTERLINALDTFKGRRVLLPLDIKTIVPNAVSWWEGTLYRYTIPLSKRQRESGLVLVVNPAFPHLVAAVLPTVLARTLRAVPYHQPDVEPFPMELSPFVMPVTYLAQAVREVVKFHHNPQRGYRNPYNGMIITQCPAPILFPVEDLLPVETNHITDWPDFVVVWRAFHQFSTKFRVERAMVSRLTGDFRIVHLGSHVRAAVEMKRGQMFHDARSGTIKHVSISANKTSALFTPLTAWDFLLSIRGPKALFVSRDDLPLTWFTEAGPDDRHEWRAGHAFLHKHVLDWHTTAMAGFVKGVEAVLEEQLARTGRLGAVRDIPFVLPPAAEVQRYWHWTDPDAIAAPVANDWHPDRGTVKYRSRQKFHARLERLLQQQCRQSSFGALSRNGYHPSAWYNLALGVFDAARPVHFAELGMETLFLFVNFAELHDLDLCEPTDRRRPSPFFHATHGESPSVYIMTPHPPDLEARGLNWCVVSSLHLQGDEDRTRWNQDVLTHGWLGKRETNDRKGLKPIRLNTSESTHAYHVPEHEAVRLFERLFRRWAGVIDKDALDELEETSYRAFNMALHVVSKRDIIEQFVQLSFGDSLWTGRLRVLAKSGWKDEDEGRDADADAHTGG